MRSIMLTVFTEQVEQESEVETGEIEERENVEAGEEDEDDLPLEYADVPTKKPKRE